MLKKIIYNEYKWNLSSYLALFISIKFQKLETTIKFQNFKPTIKLSLNKIDRFTKECKFPELIIGLCCNYPF